jgi:membrane protein required for colicin V production
VSGFDLFVLGVIVISGLFAFWRGFVREALSIAAWILAALAAFYAYPYAVPIAERFLPKGMIANVSAGAAVFVIALIVLHIIAKALASRVKHSQLSAIDRTFGLIFGLARGAIIVCIGYLVLGLFLPAGEDRPQWLTESRTVPYLAAGAGQLEHYFSRSNRPNLPGRSANSVEREAERAISAFTNPNRSIPLQADSPTVYTPNEQRDLNRLIEQQNSQ